MTTAADLHSDGCQVRMVDPERVATTKEFLINSAEARRLADGFKLLGEPSRLRILYALYEADELCVCDLAAAVGVTETVVSHSMRLLRTAGIVANRRDGRVVYYRLDDAHVRLLLEVSRAHDAHRPDADADTGA
jgi:DNA-binding transcriptional ArsR family regulator